MPIPAPSKGESEKDFIGRCMTFQSKEKDLSDDGVRRQALAICYSTYEDAKKAKTEARIRRFAEIILEDSDKE